MISHLSLRINVLLLLYLDRLLLLLLLLSLLDNQMLLCLLTTLVYLRHVAVFNNGLLLLCGLVIVHLNQLALAITLHQNFWHHDLTHKEFT